MKYILYILVLIALVSCLNDKSKQADNLTDPGKVIFQAFSDVDSLLNIDNGKFWNKKLYGPIIVVDPETRIFYSNENSSTKSFKQIGRIYTDSLPQVINIANTALDWNGKRWSMVMLPLPKERTSRNNLIIHELFHRVQPEIGFDNLQELDNGHLDTYEGRLLLKLELQALERAINSNDSIAKLNHIQNALTFRSKRYKKQKIKSAENSLELNEGLAEYTALMLSGRNTKEIKTHLSQSKNDFYSNPTFVRSFAYQTIPIYGYLLSMKIPNWHKKIDKNANLTDYLIKTFGVNTDTKQSAEKIAVVNNYSYKQIENEEREREKVRTEKIAILKTKFTKKPTLELPLQNVNISFDPRNITPIENLGKVYSQLRITDNWGILTADSGALLAYDWSKVTVSAPMDISHKTVVGVGWRLELNPKWEIKKKENKYKLEEQ